MALKGKLGMFSCFEVDIIRLYLDPDVIFILLFDEVDKTSPDLSVNNFFRQRRVHIESGANIHGYR